MGGFSTQRSFRRRQRTVNTELRNHSWWGWGRKEGCSIQGQANTEITTMFTRGHTLELMNGAQSTRGLIFTKMQTAVDIIRSSVLKLKEILEII